jgi:cellulose synthase/poly-beta-1,6-N-acetylglucosamine synthase-like glycosyltransferase
MDFLSHFTYWGGIILCVPCGFLLLEVVAGVLGRGRRLDPVGDAALKGVLLIPAHDEESLLGEMLQRLATVTSAAPHADGLRTVVIADNCSDATASIARDAGVEVWEREHAILRGKPYALAWALEKMQEDPPEVVVFLDADSWFASGSPSELAQAASASGRPVQAIYRMADSGLRGFAFRFRNEVRLRGLQALGAPTQLTGSGFAVPWSLLQQHPVPVGELVEDAYWGWTFTRAGAGPILATEVEVLSELPATKQGAQTQLRRWEHGILSATLRNLPNLLRSALLPPRPTRILHLLDVLVPPLALLGLASSGLLLVGLFSEGFAASVPALSALGALAVAVLLGWWAYGRSDLPFLRLLAAPFYALGKIGVYSTFLFRRQKGWDRTDRDDS